MQYYDQIFLAAALIGIFANCVQVAVVIIPLFNRAGAAMSLRIKLVTALSVFAIITAVAAVVYASRPQFKNEQLVRESWRSLDAKEYDHAIASAEECVALFGTQAAKEQEELSLQKAGRIQVTSAPRRVRRAP